MTPTPDLDRRSGGRFMAYKWALGLGAAVLQSAVYFGIGHSPLQRSTELLRTPIDDALPFLPWTAWLYMPIYAAIFVICLVGIRSKRIFDRAILSVLGVAVVGALGHLFVRAEYPRPALPQHPADLSSAFLALVWRVDSPANVFPSLHVAQTSSLALMLAADRRGLGRIAIGLGAILAASTLTTKQHFVADVAAGYLIAFAASGLVLRGLRPGAGAGAGAFTSTE